MDFQPPATAKLVLSDDPAEPLAIQDAEVDLAFLSEEFSSLNPCVRVSAGMIADHLAHAVAATPADLLRHTQRIFFYYNRQDSDGLYSALYDLFVTLNNKGSRLRRRLLEGSRDRLLREQFAALSGWLNHGEPPSREDLPLPGQSILNRGITGVKELVEVTHFEKSTQRDALLEARERIEYFQIDEARELLEAAILEQPEREELHTELIHLYQATRDINGLRAMREKLSQLLPELPECWLTLGERPNGGEKK